jgi:hypothetical protein
MSNQLFEDGNVADVNNNQLECVSVSYSEVDGVKSNFSYTFRLKSELDAEREAAKAAEVAAAPAATDVTPAEAPVSNPAQTELVKEETQYVK